MRKILYQGCALLLFLCVTKKTFSQVSVSGLTCVVSGILYEYTIRGQWDSSTTMQICINNGLIQDSTGSNRCSLSGKPANVILVMWNDSSSDIGSVSITSSVGNALFNVNFTQPLLPGTIDSASKTQVLNYGSVPASITCSPDSGGACSPIYNYQWQQSSNRVGWQDISGAKSSSLSLNDSLIQTVYYRRKVTENISGSIGYSDVASVFIIVMPTDSITNIASDSTHGSSGVHFQKSLENYGVYRGWEVSLKFRYELMLKRKKVNEWSAINKSGSQA